MTLNKQQLLERFQLWSLSVALWQQHLTILMDRLRSIVPDLKQQYTAWQVDSVYWETKSRGLQSFQIRMALQTFELFVSGSQSKDTIVDIGDSAGTHLQYLKALLPSTRLRCLSINIDEKAVDKIKSKGMDALLARAEDLPRLGIDADIFLLFETLEHLSNPSSFLANLATHSNCRALVLTVPYVSASRVGLHHIRRQEKKVVTPENTHIFELAPHDWSLLFQHSGWKVLKQQIYYQYPRWSVFSLAFKYYWMRHDFEGFWGAILVREPTWKNLYSGWTTYLSENLHA